MSVCGCNLNSDVATVFKIENKSRDRGKCGPGLVAESDAIIFYLMHIDHQVTLNCIENKLDLSVNWVVRRVVS